MRLLLASGSAPKLVELRRMLAAHQVAATVVGLGDLVGYAAPVETGARFEDNALIKARAGWAHSGWATLADDSGIEVDVLNQMPGVRSARWAGVGASDQENLQLLVRQLADVEPARRVARFVCAMALVWDGGQVVRRGVVEGQLAAAPRGDNGFGYDPIFVPAGHTRTTAEMSAAEKDALSHRGRALRAIIDDIRALGPGLPAEGGR
jgi:XTP/dITP diphosphohydrolase